MKFIISILIIAALAFGLSLFLPWWIAAIPAFAVAIIYKGNAAKSFFRGFLAVALAWLLNTWLITMDQGFHLANRMGELFGVPADIPLAGSTVVMLLTLLVAGILGGLAAVSGNYFRQLFLDD